MTFEDEHEEYYNKTEVMHNLIATVHPNPEEDTEYASDHAMLIRCVITEFNLKINMFGANFAQQYLLSKGLKKYGRKGKQATSEELNQLHRRNCFTLIKIADLMKMERKKAMQALMFLTEKRDGTIKG